MKENKEDFMKKVLEEKIFNELKDCYFGGKKDMISRYKDYQVDYDDIYRRIINYRIEKYGTSFVTKPTKDFYVSRKEYIKRADRRRQARYSRRKREEMR